jgi:hypothetical protein
MQAGRGFPLAKPPNVLVTNQGVAHVSQRLLVGDVTRTSITAYLPMRADNCVMCAVW